jgi:hypothetical protein
VGASTSHNPVGLHGITGIALPLPLRQRQVPSKYWYLSTKIHSVISPQDNLKKIYITQWNLYFISTFFSKELFLRITEIKMKFTQ